MSKTKVPKEIVLFARQKGCAVEDVLDAARAMVGDTYKYLRKPVGIREFIESPHYMNAKGLVYPKVLDELELMNSGEYTEVIFTGSIGSAKTTGAVYTQAYQLYLLSCYASPHAEFKLDPSTEIVIVIQSLNLTKAKEVGYDRIKAMIDASPYFQRYFPYNKQKESVMEFPNRIILKPVAGHETATIGENVIGGLIDEVNYMENVEKSKKSIDGEIYDQATAVYNSLALRRKNRFMQQGKQPGILALVSSRRYPGQFTDKKEAEAKAEIERTGKTTIYIYDKRSWDIHEPERYGGKWFKVFTGDLSRQPRMLDDDEEVRPEDLSYVVDVPEEFRENFERDIMQALRDVAGISTLSKHPFIPNANRVAECFGTHRSILSLNETDLLHRVPQIYPKRFYKPSVPRWMHIDLGYTGDAAGISCGMVDRFVRITRGNAAEQEQLPQVRFDFNLRVVPPRGGEIIFEQIRSLIYLLRELGLNIRWVTLDSYQSVDTMQILRSRGFSVGNLSVDKDTAAYDLFKTGLMDRRIDAPSNDFALREIVSLELDVKAKNGKGNVDHPPNFSKDVADSMAGVVKGLSTRREVYAMHGIPPREIPKSIKQVVVSSRQDQQDDRTARSRSDRIAEVDDE